MKCDHPGDAFVIACECVRARRTSDGHHDLPLERRAVSLRVSLLRAQRHSERQLAWDVSTGLCETDWNAPSGRRAAAAAQASSWALRLPKCQWARAEDPELPPKAPAPALRAEAGIRNGVSR